MAIQNFISEQIDEIFDKCKEIKIYIDNISTTYQKGSKEFNDMLQLWQIRVNSGYEMPAFGVSIHDLTIKELEKGIYIEFIFDKQESHNDMPYETLLVKLQENQYGYQLIRQYDGKYQGRCLYINTTEVNDDLLNYIQSNINKKD